MALSPEKMFFWGAHQKGRSNGLNKVFKNIHIINTTTSNSGLLLTKKTSIEIYAIMLKKLPGWGAQVIGPMYPTLGHSDLSPRICTKEGSDCLSLAIFSKDSFSQ